MKSLESVCLCLAVLVVGRVRALPGGAPSSACGSMTPSHGFGAQSGPTPFVTLPQSTSVNGNAALRVVLQSSTSATFKGFLVMAFDESGAIRGPIGTFASPSDGRTLSCSNGLPNAATHSNRNPKSDVVLEWTPPADFQGSVVFKTTFVQSRDTFWVAVPSTSVSVLSSAPTPAVTTPPAAPPTTPLVPAVPTLPPVPSTTWSPSTSQRPAAPATPVAPAAPVTSAPKPTAAAAALFWSPSVALLTAVTLLLSHRL